jgi:hypothetical protein
MAKHLRFNSLSPIQAPSLDGHRYELRFDVGELVNGTFEPLETYKMPVTVSGTVQEIWQQSDTQVAATAASSAAHIITDVASSGRLGDLKEVNLTTYTVPREPPPPLRVGPDTLIPIPEAPTVEQPGGRISFLSEDISAERDHVNALSGDLYGERLLELPQERAILDVYKPTRTQEEFRSRVASIATICTAINKDLLRRELGTDAATNAGSLTLLDAFLKKIATVDQATSVCGPLKNINHLRKGFPTHGDNTDQFLPAHDFFKLKYPIEDYAAAWDTLLGAYLNAMKSLRNILSDERSRQSAKPVPGLGAR